MDLIKSFSNFQINELYLQNALYSNTKRHILVGLENEYDIRMRKIVGENIFRSNVNGLIIEIEFDKSDMKVKYKILKNNELLNSKEFSLYSKKGEISDDFTYSLIKSLSSYK
jgi:hypothetical protein